MKKPIISVRLNARDYSGLANLGNRLIVALTGNANFITPAVTLLILQGFITDVENAIAQWGPKGNRGNHADLVDLQLKARILADAIKAEAQYVQTTANIAAGSVMTVVQISSLVLTPPQAYYVFFSIIEIGCTALIVWYSWKWSHPESGVLHNTDSALLHSLQIEKEEARCQDVMGSEDAHVAG